MIIGGDAHALQTLAESIGTALAIVVGYNDRTYKEPPVLELRAQTQHIHIVGYSKVITNLVFLNIDGTDHNHDFSMVAQLAEHTQLTVGLETGEHTARMMVIKKFTPQLKIKFVAELRYTLLDVFGLDFEIFLVVKTVFHNGLQNYKMPLSHATPLHIVFQQSHAGLHTHMSVSRCFQGQPRAFRQAEKQIQAMHRITGRPFQQIVNNRNNPQ